MKTKLLNKYLLEFFPHSLVVALVLLFVIGAETATLVVVVTADVVVLVVDAIFAEVTAVEDVLVSVDEV